MKPIILILLIMLIVGGGGFFHRSPAIGGGVYAVLLIVLLMRIKALPSEISDDAADVSVVDPIQQSGGDNFASLLPPPGPMPTKSNADATSVA